MMSAPAVTSALASERCRLDGQRSASTPQCRKTTTVSAVLRGAPDLLHEPRDVLRGREPRLPRARGPRRDQVVVEDLRRADDRDPLAVHRLPERGVRALRVRARADDREPVALRRRERVAEALTPRSPSRGCSRATRRRPSRRASAANALGGARKTNSLTAALPPFVIAVSRLTTARSACPSTGSIGSEHGRGRGRELVRQDAFEVDVAAEREDDLLAASERPSRPGREPPRSPRRRTPRTSPKPAARSASTSSERAARRVM